MSKRKWILAGAILATLIALAAIVLFSMRGRIQGLIRNETEAYLRSKFRSNVEFKDFEVSLRPGVHVVVTELVLRHDGRATVRVGSP